MSSRERIENDPDLKLFARELMNTREGARYTRRWRLLKDGQRVLKEALGSGDKMRIAHARSNYIHLSNLCSDALGDLETEYHWPS